jgi:hypothetical protein
VLDRTCAHPRSTTPTRLRSTAPTPRRSSLCRRRLRLRSPPLEDARAWPSALDDVQAPVLNSIRASDGAHARSRRCPRDRRRPRARALDGDRALDGVRERPQSTTRPQSAARPQARCCSQSADDIRDVVLARGERFKCMENRCDVTSGQRPGLWPERVSTSGPNVWCLFYLYLVDYFTH